MFPVYHNSSQCDSHVPPVFVWKSPNLQTWSLAQYTGNCLQCWILKQCVRSILPAFNFLVFTPTTYSARLPCSPPLAIQAYMWSGLLKVESDFFCLFVLFVFRTVYAFKLSQEVEGQLWAWCAELHPVVAELGVNGSQSSRASL